MSTMIASELESKPKAEVTPEELLAMPDGGHYELIDGELRERKMSLLSSRVALRMGRYLDIHCDEHNLGWVMDAECGYRCFPWMPRRVRRPDVSFISRDRLPSEAEWSEGYVTIPPDLAVGVSSPSDLVSDLEEKVEEFLRAGVRLVWVVHPEIRAVQVYRADGTVARFRENEEVSGEDVLPGFRCRVGSLFPTESQRDSEQSMQPAAPSVTPGS